MSKLTKALTAAAGNAGGDNLYVEDVFSTYLYTGNDTDTNIVNGINLADEGGLVWIKSRQAAEGHRLIDSEWSLSANKYIDSSSTTAPFSGPVVNTFNTDGFQLDSNWYGNSSDPQYGGDFASWTFRKAEKFFDVQTYTGNGGTPQNISHSLGSVPGLILVKRTDSAFKWFVYHTSTGATKYLQLNDTAGAVTYGGYWNSTAPTDSVFTIGTDTNGNASGGTYVAYLFASDAGGFGDDGDENIIKCGSYTGNATKGLQVNCGFEPQLIITKRTDTSGHGWMMYDTMRGFVSLDDSQGGGKQLLANSSNAEAEDQRYAPTATGFELKSTGASVNASGGTYIYIAIRRPMKTPESGTEVFALQDPGYPLGSNGLAYTSGFPVDLALLKERTSSSDGWYTMSRMQGSGRYMKTNLTNAETSGVSNGTFDHNTGWYKVTNASMSWMFKRATGFFDVVAYTGNGSGSGQVINHNLGVTPEIIIIKGRSNSGREWHTYVSSQGQDKALFINSSGAEQANTALVGGTINSTQYELKVDFGNVNGNGETYISYLFATVAGVSKVGSVVHSGTTNVDCGFSAGARFVMAKRTDASGDWFIWDSVRGIVAGNDPYMLLNSAAAEVTNTDYIDPLSSGFTLTSSFTAGTYIFLAIA